MYRISILPGTQTRPCVVTVTRNGVCVGLGAGFFSVANALTSAVKEVRYRRSAGQFRSRVGK